MLVYGLVRSLAMLTRTAPSLEEFILRPLGRRAVALVHVYCFPPLCDPSHTHAVLSNFSTKVLSVSVTSAFPKPSLPPHAQPFGCRSRKTSARAPPGEPQSYLGLPPMTREDDPHRHATWSVYYAALSSLRTALAASALAQPPVGSIVIARCARLQKLP